MRKRKGKGQKPSRPAPAGRQNGFVDAIRGVAARLDFPARFLLLLYSTITLCPVRVHPVNPTLDPSWAYALNDAHSRGLVWGRDIGFTYGPWAYLAIAMNVGNNLFPALLFQTGVWFLFMTALGWLVFTRKVSLLGLALFAFLLPRGQGAMHDFGYAGVDHFIGILVVLLLGCALVAEFWLIPFSIAVALASVLLLIKFSAAIFALAAVVVFPLALWWFDRGKARQAFGITALGVPAIFALGFLSHSPLPSALAGFLRTSLERASSYSASSSLSAEPHEVQFAAAVFFLFVLLAAVLRESRQPSFWLVLCLVGPWFLIFKHAFVRPPGHSAIFVTMGALLWAVVLLFTRIARPDWWRYALVIGAYLWLSGLPGLRWSLSVTASQFRMLAPALHPEKMRATLDATSGAKSADRLPDALLARIGQAPVSVFPWELSYGAANPINLRPMPMLQSYGADSAYLDRWNADLFEDPSRRPPLVLVEWDSIDGRHPFMDVPATFLSLYRGYTVDSLHGSRLLIRSAKQPRFQQMVSLGATRIQAGTVVNVPDSPHPVLARLRMKLTASGEVNKFFWKIPEINLATFTRQGRFRMFRVVADVLNNAGAINFLPSSLSDLSVLLEKNVVADPVTRFLISGPGLRFYEAPIEVEFVSLPEVQLTLDGAPALDLTTLRYRGPVPSWQVELINGVDAAGRKEVISVPAPDGYVAVRGWAVDDTSEACPSGIVIELDGKPIPAVYGLPRAEIPLIVKGSQCRTGGFVWGLPAADLGHAPHELTVKVIAPDGKGWYEANRRVRFRIQ